MIVVAGAFEFFAVVVPLVLGWIVILLYASGTLR